MILFNAFKERAVLVEFNILECDIPLKKGPKESAIELTTPPPPWCYKALGES